MKHLTFSEDLLSIMSVLSWSDVTLKDSTHSRGTTWERESRVLVKTRSYFQDSVSKFIARHASNYVYQEPRILFNTKRIPSSCRVHVTEMWMNMSVMMLIIHLCPKKNRVIMIELRGDRYSMKNSETYCCIHANQKDCGVENWMRITW